MKMTNTQRKIETDSTAFKVISGGKKRKKRRERMLGAVLLSVGTAFLIMEGDATLLFFLSFIALPMIFSKSNVTVK